MDQKSKNGPFVVDSNVITKLYLRDEPWTDKADTLFQRFAEGEVAIVAPRLALYEVPAAIRRAVIKGRINELNALEAIRRFQQLPLPLIEERPAVLEEAFRLANRYLCTFYDAVYLQLAEHLGWSFITADEKSLIRPLGRRLSYLVALNSLS